MPSHFTKDHGKRAGLRNDEMEGPREKDVKCRRRKRIKKNCGGKERRDKLESEFSHGINPGITWGRFNLAT